jgi:membrane associated rhomboid family serine protease
MKTTAQRRLRDEAKLIFAVIGLIWLVFLVDKLTPLSLTGWGLIPRDVTTLSGILTMPFIHGTWSHIIGNTIPLLVLLLLLAGSQARSIEVVTVIVLLGGVLLWCFGRGGRCHVGASGVIYGLIAFLIVAGFLERRFLPLMAALLTGFFYGSSLLTGILPTAGSMVSWDGHLSGAIAGAAIAFFKVKST